MRDRVESLLSRFAVPPFGKDLVALGALRAVDSVRRADGGTLVRVDLALGGALRAAQARVLLLVYKALEHLEGADDVEVTVDGRPAPRPQRRAPRPIPGVTHVVAVASGKGGVGKSTVAANLAVALAARGLAVGLLDADVYGPNIPTMMGLAGAARVAMDRGRLRPLAAHGVNVLSVGLLGVDAGAALVWRGPLLGKVVNQLLFQVDWAPLDVLVVDLPPGTGDVPLTLFQSAPLSGAVVVATPQDVALEDAARALAMLRDADVPVLGLVENMAFFVCTDCGHRAELFGRGGVRRAAETRGLPLLAELPLVEAIRVGCDTGHPAALDPKLAHLFTPLADAVAEALTRRTPAHTSA